MFKKFLSLPIYKKIIITYTICWLGFLFSFSLGQIFKLLSSIFHPIKEGAEIVRDVGVAKYEVAYHVAQKTVDNPYLSYILSYFLSNITACLMIVVVFSLFGYLSRDDEEKKFIKYLFILYIFAVINPITGIVGYNLPIYALIYVLPHGFFEFLGFSIAIVLGVELAKNLYYKKKIEKKVIYLIILIFVLIFIAASLEPIDWAIYNSKIGVLEGYKIIVLRLL